MGGIVGLSRLVVYLVLNSLMCSERSYAVSMKDSLRFKASPIMASTVICRLRNNTTYLGT